MGQDGSLGKVLPLRTLAMGSPPVCLSLSPQSSQAGVLLCLPICLWQTHLPPWEA
jgi:hypothetical protein